jgi:hypothetical protein
MGFELDKWYLDAVSPDGRAVIAYRASMRWGLFRIGYSAVILRDQDGRLEDRRAAASGSEVVATPGTWSWESGALRFGGVWSAVSPGLERVLLTTGEGGIRWACVAPAAEVEVRQGRASWRGRGYVERLTMTLPPWRLPIDRLVWGRWVGGSASVVWIVWEGPHPLSLVVVDGREDPGARVTGAGVTLGDGRRLTLARRAVLRDGEVGRSLSRVLPGLRRLLPRATLGRVERKWLSDGELSGGGVIDGGWAIHERVDLGGRRA